MDGEAESVGAAGAGSVACGIAAGRAAAKVMRQRRKTGRVLDSFMVVVSILKPWIVEGRNSGSCAIMLSG